MPDPISSAHRDIAWNVPDAEAELHDGIVDQLERDPYAGTSHQPTFVGAVIFGDDTNVSNACRRAQPGTFDAYVCDDRNLEKLQSGAFDIAKQAVWELFKGLAGARGGK